MSDATPTDPKRSPVEGDQGEQPAAPRHHRRGAGAADATTSRDAGKNLLKFHGSYQQEDRDARKNRRKDGRRQALHVHGPLQDPRRRS